MADGVAITGGSADVVFSSAGLSIDLKASFIDTYLSTLSIVARASRNRYGFPVLYLAEERSRQPEFYILHALDFS